MTLPTAPDGVPVHDGARAHDRLPALAAPSSAVPGRGASPSYAARAVVDLAAIRSNVRALAARAPSARIMAVVKADAYGHGLVPSALAALAGGATWLGTAQPSEALALRAAGIGPDRARILAWLYPPGTPLRPLVDADVDVSAAAPWAVDAVVEAARAAGRPARVHLKVDTGLGRGGSTPADFPDLLDAAVAAQGDGAIEVVGLWSHLAFADEPGHPTIHAQADAFDDAVRLAEAAGARLEVRHLANSAATLTDPRTHYDLVRPGLAVYGLSPVPRIGGPVDFGLVPAMTLEARLALVKHVPAGQGVSYSHAFTTDRPTVLGLVPLGYADGIPRHASGGGPTRARGGPVLVGGPIDEFDEGSAEGPGSGRVLHVAGRVCMDQFVLDLGPYATERAGDVVTLFGPGAGLDHAGAPTAEDWARAAGTISYEITTRLGPRVPRVHTGTEILADADAEVVRLGKETSPWA